LWIPENWPRIRIPDSSDVWILDSGLQSY
jgi:hypothetical protein